MSEFSPSVNMTVVGLYRSADACGDGIKTLINSPDFLDTYGEFVPYRFEKNAFGQWQAYAKYDGDEQGMVCVCGLGDPKLSTLVNEDCD